MQRYPDALLALSYSTEKAKLPPTRYARDLVQLTYSLTW
jgi:hypothetical protein